jgi:hypothetical protein
MELRECNGRGKYQNAHKSLVGKPEEKKEPRGRPMYWRE